ncbi:MAG: hypothetical protein IJX58_07940, partial [Clostridia bacterium]|nr:hypothetical protein [Clostridia bacterium]
VCQVCFEETNPNATHNIVHVEAKAATCFENGNIEYWYCEACGYAWADEALTQQTNMMSIVTPMAHAPATHVEANAATCYENGNIEYWYCEACGQAWLDEACTLNTNLMAVVLPMAHAPATHVEAKAATCYENGNIEYWYCEACGQAWLDEACTLNTNVKSVILPMAHAPATHVEAVAATCTENGNIEYWLCEACGQAWLDEACTLNTNVKSVILPALGHADENGDYKCDACSTKMLPDDGTVLTIPQALAIAKLHGHNTYTTQKYYITGIVTNVYNTQYGNFYLKDADGNEICIYGLYMDGTRYDAMNYKPVEGDEVTVYGPLGAYNTTYQMKNAELDDVVAHEHDYVAVVTDPTCTKGGYTTHTCSICQGYIVDSETEALGHTTENGECERCGQTIGGDVVNNETFTADFNTVNNTNTSYTTVTTTSGWVATNAAVFKGGTTDSSPAFKMIGDASNRALCINGKTSAKGTITSPTISGGISKLSLKYGLPFSDTKIGFTINIKQNGVVVSSKTISNNSATKLTAYTLDWDLAADGVAVSGDFVIEIVNNSPSNSSSNKDRTAIWDVQWTTNY